MPRLFTALEIPSSVSRGLSGLRGGLAGAHWIEPENYHITLCFIGDVDGRMADEIASALNAVRRAPFQLTVEGVACLGAQRQRSVVAVVEESDKLMELQDEQERLLRRLGLELEGRHYIPHVTLARLRQVPSEDIAGYLTTQGGFAPVSFKASRFVLFSSRASSGGGPYVVEAAYELKKGR